MVVVGVLIVVKASDREMSHAKRTRVMTDAQLVMTMSSIRSRRGRNIPLILVLLAWLMMVGIIVMIRLS